MGKKWVPLESNPEVFNRFAQKLGMDTDQWAFTDVFGLDEELLVMVPQPVLAVLMLFPITDETEAAQGSEEARIAAEGQTVAPDMFYMKQTISNACGTVALLHAVGNTKEFMPLAEGSFLKRFLEDTASMSPQERAAYLEEPPADAPDVDDAHQCAAQEGDTAPPGADENVLLHFVALVHRAGCLYELDGRKKRPINHGPTSPDRLLQDAAVVVRKFVELSNSHNFSLMALSAAQ